MADILKNSRLRREQQFFFLNDNIIPSVQNIEGNYDIGAAPIPFLGMDVPVIQPRGPQQGTINLSYLTAGPDQFIHLTGSSGFNGFIVEDKTNPVRNFSFTSGYLTSYRSTCSVGEIPQNNVSIVVLGDIGKLATNNSKISGYFSGMATKTFPTPTIASYGTIELNLEEFNTNRVLSYDLNYQINRNPIYSLGSNYPIDVKTNNPIDFTATVELDVNDYVFNNLRRYPCNVTLTGLSVKLKEYKQPYNEIITYNVGNCILQSESYNANINGNVKGTLVFKSYLQPPGSSNELTYDNPISQPPNPDDPVVQTNYCTGSTYYTGYTYHNWNGNFIYQIGNPLEGAIYLKCTGVSGFRFSNMYWFDSFTGTSPKLQTVLSGNTNYTFNIYLENSLVENFCIKTPTGCLSTLTTPTTTTTTTTPTTTTTTTTSTTSTTTTTTTTSTTSTTTTTTTPTTTTTTTTTPANPTILWERFEGNPIGPPGGYQYSWTETDPSDEIIDNYSLTVLEGSYSLYMPEYNGSFDIKTVIDFPDEDDIYIYFKLRVTELHGIIGNNSYFMQIGNGLNFFYLSIDSDGHLTFYETQWPEKIQINQTYHVWLHYIKSTDSESNDGLAEFAVSSTSTRPEYQGIFHSGPYNISSITFRTDVISKAYIVDDIKVSIYQI